MAARSEKAALIAAWRAHLEERLGALVRSRDQARAGTQVDGDHRPENRGERAAVTSQGYLAHGLGQRIAALSEALSELERMGDGPRGRVVVGALVLVEDDRGRRERFAVFPGGDASALEHPGGAVRVLSRAAPLVRALYGLEAGDIVEIERGGEEREVAILSVE